MNSRLEIGRDSLIRKNSMRVENLLQVRIRQEPSFQDQGRMRDWPDDCSGGTKIILM